MFQGVFNSIFPVLIYYYPIFFGSNCIVLLIKYTYLKIINKSIYKIIFIKYLVQNLTFIAYF
jgi:hypothetical protein